LNSLLKAMNVHIAFSWRFRAADLTFQSSIAPDPRRRALERPRFSPPFHHNETHRVSGAHRKKPAASQDARARHDRIIPAFFRQPQDAQPHSHNARQRIASFITE
jgi:hypothetical protein